MRLPFSSPRATAPAAAASETPGESTAPRPSGLPRGNRPLLLGLLGLVVAVTAIGAWNEQHKPRASFKITDSDLAPDPLAPAPNAGPDASPSPAPDAVTASSAPAAAAPASVRIAARDVNIRRQPSRKAPVVEHPRQGSVYALSGNKRQAEGIDWIGLKLADGHEAWIGSSFVSPVSSQADASTVASPKDEIAAAAQVVSQLLVAPGKAWPQAPDALRELTVHALLKQIFKDKPAALTPQHAPALDACMKASANDKQLENLKVYEVAAACALGLGWR